MTTMRHVVLHVPHNACFIPDDERSAILLDDAALARELLAMTDAHTDALFPLTGAEAGRVVCPVSRLVCDVERFPDDAEEPMAARGMGVVYTRTSTGGTHMGSRWPLRHRPKGWGGPCPWRCSTAGWPTHAGARGFGRAHTSWSAASRALSRGRAKSRKARNFNGTSAWLACTRCTGMGAGIASRSTATSRFSRSALAAW